jgi:RNA polymerase-binding transcription factor DksA
VATKAAQTTSKAAKSKSSNKKPVKSPSGPKVSISSLKVSQAKTDTVKANPQSSTHTQSAEPVKKATPAAASRKEISEEWVLQQRERIFELRDNLLESMHGVAKDTLRSRAEGSEASAFGMHQADAGSDSYDRDFALSLLSQEQDALYEIDEALKRIELGTYGICEMSGKVIMKARLEALPFARYTVECQSEVERQKKLHKARMPVTSLFGLTDEESSESEEEDQPIDAKD